MRIEIIESHDYKTYRTAATYQDGKWTGDPGTIEMAKEIVQDRNIDLETQAGAKKFTVLLSGSRIWAKIKPGE